MSLISFDVRVFVGRLPVFENAGRCRVSCESVVDFKLGAPEATICVHMGEPFFGKLPREGAGKAASNGCLEDRNAPPFRTG
jgi:hypothetical protein